MTLHHKGKMLWWSYFRSSTQSINLDRCGNFIEKFNFVSTPSKIIIPIAHHPPYHPLNTPSPMPPPTLHPPPHPSPAHHTPHHPPTSPPTTHPWRKSGTLMPRAKKWGLNTPPHPQPHPTTNPPHPPHPTTTYPTTPHPIIPTHRQRKSGALMSDISWAPPHSLPIR